MNEYTTEIIKSSNVHKLFNPKNVFRSHQSHFLTIPYSNSANLILCVILLFEEMWIFDCKVLVMKS